MRCKINRGCAGVLWALMLHMNWCCDTGAQNTAAMFMAPYFGPRWWARTHIMSCWQDLVGSAQ